MVHRICIWLVYVSTILLIFIIFMQVKTCQSSGCYGTVTFNFLYQKDKVGDFLVDVPPKIAPRFVEL